MNAKKSFFLILSLVLLAAVTGCDWLVDLQEDQTPTNELMQGTWEVVEAYDISETLEGTDSTDILDNISFPLCGFHLSSDNGVSSTAGPMWMYVVYGGNKYTEIASKVDQVFNYAGTDFTNGEWFIDKGVVVDSFTIEMKLEGLPGQKALTDLLSLLNIQNQYLEQVIYHKFMNVTVDFSPLSNDTMYWVITSETHAQYNYKDNQGNKVLWSGWPVTSFSRCGFTLARKVKDLQYLVEEATSGQ